MTALANSLLRIWTASRPFPRLTGRGTANFINAAWDLYGELLDAARRHAPTLVLIALRIFQ